LGKDESNGPGHLFLAAFWQDLNFGKYDKIQTRGGKKN
jgi:hypothetical protein